MQTAMILNAENRGGLALVRSLGRRGISIIAGGSRRLSRACYSKYVDHRFVYPSTYNGTTATAKALLGAVKKYRPDVLFPIFSDTCSIVLQNLSEFEKYTKVIRLIDEKRFHHYLDKEKMIQSVKKAGFDIPSTYYPKSIQDMKKMDIRFPALVKPRIASGGKGIKLVDDMDQLVRAYKSIASGHVDKVAYDPTLPIIQEFVNGIVTYTIYVLFDKGKCLASTVSKNTIHYPEDFGPPVECIIVSQPEIQKHAIRMFEKLRWDGPANVHFIVDEKGVPRFIELNPRIWATIESSIAAGVDFPWYMFNIALGKSPRIDKHHATDFIFRWRLFGGIFQSIRGFRKSRRKREHSEISLSDPMPHTVHLLDLIFNRQVL